MNIKALLITFVIALVLAIGGYWLYQRQSSSSVPSLRSLIPPDAVLVYSIQQPGVALDSLQHHALGEIFKDIPSLQRMKGYKEQLLALSPASEALLKNRELLFSLHITERNNFDYLLLLPLGTQKDQGLLQDLNKALAAQPDHYKITQRTYLGEELIEIRALQEGRTFSFYVLDGVLTGSFTSFLVEAALRHRKEGLHEAELPAWLLEETGSRVLETMGTVALNMQQLPALLRMFAQNDSLVQDIVPRLPYFSHLEAITAPEGLLLTGFTKPQSTEDPDFLWALHNQKPQVMGLEYLVPQRTATLMFLGLSAPQQWHERLRNYWERKAPEQWERWQVLDARVPGAKKLIALLGNEAGLATIPAVGAGQPDRLLLLQLADSAAAGQLMHELVKQMAPGATLYSENFMGQQLQELPYQELPAAFLGSAYLGFKESYYTIVDRYLVVSSSIPALKDMLMDVQAEDTWQRSLRINKFMARLDREQNYALFLNTTSLWPMLYSRLAPPWKAFWDKHGMALRQVDLLSLQLSAAEGSFYTNLFMHMALRPERQLEQIRLLASAQSLLPSPIVHAPAAVSYRTSQGGHWLVQDSSQSLYLVNHQGKVLHAAPLGGYWQQQVIEIDPQKNKTPHYFMATADSAYVLRPDLLPLRPFPLALPQLEKIAWSKALDYDGSRRYRFLLADASGNLYMYDLDGINLEGWQPLAIGGALSMAPGHMRVRSRDIIYAFQKKGIAHALTRKGVHLKGFPLNLGDSLAGPVHVRQGSDFKSTRFVTVSVSGLLLEWDLEGNILVRRQLYRPDARARFYLVPDSREKGYIITQQDRFRLRLLNEEGQELFEKDYLGASTLVVQYFSFSDAASLVAVTDPDQEFTYLYDLSGNLLQAQPFNSCCPIDIRLSSGGDSLRLIKAFDRQIEQYVLPVLNTSK